VPFHVWSLLGIALIAALNQPMLQRDLPKRRGNYPGVDSFCNKRAARLMRCGRGSRYDRGRSTDEQRGGNSPACPMAADLGPTGAAWYVIYLLCLWDVETLVLIVPPGGETLAVRIFNLLHYGHNSQVNALCLVLLALGLLPLILWRASQWVKPRLKRGMSGFVNSSSEVDRPSHEPRSQDARPPSSSSQSVPRQKSARDEGRGTRRTLAGIWSRAPDRLQRDSPGVARTKRLSCWCAGALRSDASKGGYQSGTKRAAWLPVRRARKDRRAAMLGAPPITPPPPTGQAMFRAPMASFTIGVLVGRCWRLSP
jgi:hypothetical protein